MPNIKPLRYVRSGGDTVGLSEVQANETIAITDIEPHGIDSLNDVTISAPTAGQVIGYNGSQWANIAAPASGGSETFNPFLLMGA